MIAIAEAISQEPVVKAGRRLHRARLLPPGSEKYRAIQAILKSQPVSYFLTLHTLLCRLLGDDTPLYLVTDWSDPSEVIGLRLETDKETTDYPDLCFLAFYTDWERLPDSGIEEIFAHELSHLWLSRMGFDFSRSKSNKFHTCTAITDPYLAFSEGFAEHLEIVTQERGDSAGAPQLWDDGYDLDAWLCNRDSQLRLYAVKNNRFLYHTAMPVPEDQDSYQHLHMAHITSSAFMPEQLKNGLQAISSEGVVASFFYQMYRSDLLKQTKASDAVCQNCGISLNELDPETRRYGKIFYALSQMDLRKPSLLVDFLRAYCVSFPGERKELLHIFLRVTSFVTVDKAAAELFGSLYRIGRRGESAIFQQELIAARRWKQEKLEAILCGTLPLDKAIYPSIWVEGDKEVCPVPWDPGRTVRCRFDVNAATAIDYFSINGLSLPDCAALVKLREKRRGFQSVQEFQEALRNVQQTGWAALATGSACTSEETKEGSL